MAEWIVLSSCLSPHSERARVLVEFDGGDVIDLASLLYVGSVRADRKSHQVLLHLELVVERSAVHRTS